MMPDIPKLSSAQIGEIERIRGEMRARFEAVPDEGMLIEYEGREYLVYQGVFWPWQDSVALVRNYKIVPGERVLDVCTGSGVLAVEYAYRGASRVVALDINPDAVRSTIANAYRHGFGSVIDARVSDVLSALGEDEVFDVVTGNFPFTDKPSGSYVEGTMHDQGLHVWNEFLAGINPHLAKNGRMYLCQANFGSLDECVALCDAHGFDVKHIGTNDMNDGLRVFYALELGRMKE